MAHDVIVETRKLTKIYRDFWGRQGRKPRCGALNIEIHKGEIFGLLGPNGSGKTTTIKLLLGLLFPTDGEAFLFGQPAADVRKNERIGYLPEESYLYRFLNAEETLDFYGRLFDLDPGIRSTRAQELIEKVGLKADRKRILREYSKGMRQRIGLAQALINNPDLVILDEPTSGLDPLGARWMKNLIVELRNQGKTVIMCSHRLEDVQDVCDRIAILSEGELQAYGEVKTLLQDANRIEMRASDLQPTDELLLKAWRKSSPDTAASSIRSATPRPPWKITSCASSRRARHIPAGASFPRQRGKSRPAAPRMIRVSRPAPHRLTPLRIGVDFVFLHQNPTITDVCCSGC